MYLLITYGLLIIMLSSVTHSLLTWIAIHQAHNKFNSGFLLRIWSINKAILMIVLFSFLESFYWATFYHHLNVFSSFEESIYFSLITFTTLGYGDVTLPPDYRILGGLEAANGIIIFGWSTALVVAIIQKLHFSHK